jgi:hypothetical protein
MRDKNIHPSRQTAFGLLFCLIVVLAWFSPWWIGGKNLAPLDLLNGMMSPWRSGDVARFAKNHIVSDGVDQYLVYRMIAASSYAKEGWLGWSSLTYGGTAEYANTMALYFDWTMQLHRWFEFWTAWHLGLMGQVMLASAGMFLFLRGRMTSCIWSCCGALAYAANSQFVTWIYHRWALGSFCWVPWILWAIDSHRRGNRGGTALVPILIGLAFLGGTLQHAALVILVVAASWGEESIQIGRSAVQQLRLFRRFAIWGVLGAGLATMMFLPCIDAFLTSNRLGLHTGMHGNASNGVYPEGWLQPFFNLAAYPFQIFPSIFGRCNSVDVLKLFKSDLFYVAYFGSLPVLIAFLSLVRREAPPLARLLIASGLILPLTPLVRLLYQRLYFLFIFGGILAFVHFMENSSRETKLRIFKVTAGFTMIAAGAWMALSLFLQFQPGLISMLRERILTEGKGSSFGFFETWMAARADHFIGDLFIWSPHQWIPLMLLATALAGLRWGASDLVQRRTMGAILVAFAVISEVSLFGSRWIVWTEPLKDPLFPSNSESRALQEFVGRDGRVTTLIHPTSHMANTPFIPNTLAAYGVATICGYDSIVPDGMILPNASPGDAEKLGRFGVSHLVTWHGNTEVDPAWKPVWQSSSMDLYENTLHVPRYIGFRTDEDCKAFFSGSSPAAVSLQETLGLENRRILKIPSGIVSVRIAENQAEGWEYRLIGSSIQEWRPVRRAPDASMVFENPQPDRDAKIEMRYAPPLRKAGLMMSSFSLLVVLIVGGIGFLGRTATGSSNTELREPTLPPPSH